jgi:hypothetical protein
MVAAKWAWMEAKKKPRYSSRTARYRSRWGLPLSNHQTSRQDSAAVIAWTSSLIWSTAFSFILLASDKSQLPLGGDTQYISNQGGNLHIAPYATFDRDARTRNNLLKTWTVCTTEIRTLQKASPVAREAKSWTISLAINASTSSLRRAGPPNTPWVSGKARASRAHGAVHHQQQMAHGTNTVFETGTQTVSFRAKTKQRSAIANWLGTGCR